CTARARLSSNAGGLLPINSSSVAMAGQATLDTHLVYRLFTSYLTLLYAEGMIAAFQASRI
ncbi:MAG TPA: hypothetical protein V6D29_14195, partial [Leptolyngbyaceae cyanobacterium]